MLLFILGTNHSVGNRRAALPGERSDSMMSTCESPAPGLLKLRKIHTSSETEWRKVRVRLSEKFVSVQKEAEKLQNLGNHIHMYSLDMCISRIFLFTKV